MESVSKASRSSIAWMRSGAMNAMVNFLEQSGIDPVSVVGTEGIRIAEAADPYRKVSIPVMLSSFQRVADATGRPDLGLEIGLGQELEEWGPFLTLFLNAPSVGMMIRDFCQYFSAFQSGAHVERLNAGRNRLGLSYRSNHSDYPGWSIDNELSITLVMSIVNKISGSRVMPAEVVFQHKPLVDISIYSRRLGVEPQFGAGANRVIYARDVADIQSVIGNFGVYQVFSRHLRDLSERVIEENQMVHFVRNNVIHGLRARTAKLEIIAAERGMDPRSLQRRLAAEGTCFRQIVDEVRLSRARHLLKNTQLQVSDIADELGFAESRSFIRSFERLTGMTPGAYRRKDRRHIHPAS